MKELAFTISDTDVKQKFEAGRYSNEFARMHGSHASYSYHFKRLAGAYHKSGWNWSPELISGYFSEGLLSYLLFDLTGIIVSDHLITYMVSYIKNDDETFNKLINFIDNADPDLYEKIFPSEQEITVEDIQKILSVARKIKEVPLLMALGGEYLRLRSLSDLFLSNTQTSGDLLRVAQNQRLLGEVTIRALKLQLIITNWVRYFALEMSTFLKEKYQDLSDEKEVTLDDFMPNQCPKVLQSLLADCIPKYSTITLGDLLLDGPNTGSTEYPSQHELDNIFQNTHFGYPAYFNEDQRIANGWVPPVTESPVPPIIVSAEHNIPVKKQSDEERGAEKRAFQSALDKFELQVLDLEERAKTEKGCERNALDARYLHSVLQHEADDYYSNSETLYPKQDFLTFCQDQIKAQAKTASAEDRGGLAAQDQPQDHCGWSEILYNLAFLLTSILTLGIANMISQGLTGSYRFFTTAKTPPIATLAGLQSEIEECLVDKELKPTPGYVI